MHRLNALYQQVSQTANDVKTASATSLATVSTGSATWLEWIPTDIGKLATLVGLILSSVLIYTHLQKNQRAREAHELDMAIKRKELKE